MSRNKLEGSMAGQGRDPGVTTERSEGGSEGARRRAPGGRPQRLWAPRKVEAVVRVMGGEDPAVVAGELGVTVTDLSLWKDKFIKGGIEGIKQRAQDESQEVRELRAKIGELTMQLELYRKNRPAPGRSRRHSR